MAAPDVASTIRRVAAEEGFGDVDLLLSVAWQESGFDAGAVGDSGHSLGPFQEHDRGRGAGLSAAQRTDVAAATRRAIAEFRAIRARYPNVSRGEWAAKAQRPADASGYAASINRMLAGQDTGFGQAVGGVGTAPSPAGPGAGPATVAAGDAPDWLQQSWAAGGTFGKAPAARAAATTGGPRSAAGAVFPVAGYTGKVELHHGAEAGVGGSDLFAPEGTPVLSMVPGVVQWASTEALGGHNVGILGDDGKTYYYAHFKNAPRVKEGQRVGAGQQIGDVGRTGNAANTPPHLHIGIGEGIQTGAGAQGGLGRGFDAVAYLRATLSGAAPAAPDAPGVGRLTSPASTASAGTDAWRVDPSAAPDWLQQAWVAGSAVGKGVQAGVRAVGDAAQAAQELWPVVGQAWGRVNNPFGGGQARAAGATVALPSSNVGADLTAGYGAQVVAPVAGTVVEVFDAPDERDRNANHGWGGMTLLKGDNGYFYRLSHARPGSIATRPGQRVEQGQLLQQVGVSGNTTGAHLDYEKFDAPGHFVDPVAAQGRTASGAIGASAGRPGPGAAEGPWRVDPGAAPDWLTQAWDAGSTIGTGAQAAGAGVASGLESASAAGDVADRAWKVADAAAPDWLKQAWGAGSTLGREAGGVAHAAASTAPAAIGSATAGAAKVVEDAAPEWLKQAWDAGSTFGR